MEQVDLQLRIYRIILIRKLRKNDSQVANCEPLFRTLPGTMQNADPVIHGCLKCCIYGDLAFGRANPGAWGEFISTEMLDVNIRQGNPSP